MNVLNRIVLCVSIISAMTAPIATAGAASEPYEQDRLANETSALALHYEAEVVGHSVVLTLDSGSLSVADSSLQVTAPDGRLVATFPTSYQRDRMTHPIAVEIDGKTAILTPSTDPAAATPAQIPPVPLREIGIDFQSPEFNDAVANFNLQSGLGVALGSLVGTTIGAAIGCIAGGAAVGASAAVVTIGTLAIPGFLGGCLITGAALGAIGAVAGTILIGGPVTVAAALLFVGALSQLAVG